MFTRIYLLLSIITIIYMGLMIHQLDRQVMLLETDVYTVIEELENLRDSMYTTKLNFIIENQDSIDLELAQHRDLILENQYAIAKRLPKPTH